MGITIIEAEPLKVAAAVNAAVETETNNGTDARLKLINNNGKWTLIAIHTAGRHHNIYILCDKVKRLSTVNKYARGYGIEFTTN